MRLLTGVIRAIAAGSLAALLTISGISGQQVRLDVDVRAWTDDVRQHEPRTLDEPARRIASLPWTTLLPVLNEVKRRGDPDLLLLGATALLDIAVHVPLEERPLLPKLGSSTIAEDGERRGVGVLDPHLWHARQLVDRAVRDEMAPRHDEIRSHAIAWYRTVSAALLAANNLADLDPHIERSSRLFPDDPGILFDAGCYVEAYASPLMQAAMFAEGEGPKPKRRVGLLQADPRSESRLLSEAEKRFRRTIELDPTFAEARVRLGLVLMKRGRTKDAIAELERALALPADDEVKYYAQLFLGRAAAAEGSHARAIEANTAAAALFPVAQSPRLALSLLNSETVARTNDEALEGVLVRTDESERHDPWWVYYRGSGRNEADVYRAFADRVRSIRARVRGDR
ncbi:MAG TPA: tetratricopeptide repeat protein [Vicinamibacterales bacterium]